MSTYQISPFGSIDFGATGIKAKLQNASFLLATMKGTCFMDREAGWLIPVDELSESAKVQITADVVELLQNNIEGLTVEEVTFEEKPEEAILYPFVKVVFDNG
ncbi:hypothetical protein ACQRXC_08115 [Niallia taxi]|uniref:hypothetical protein n=1 Tax=Niallia taxi TaxID=2499688 RepID=UPI003F61F0D1